MAFNWLEYLDYAESVQQKDAPTEAEIRSAISRSYYSVHNLASEAVLVSTKQKKGHSELVSHYKFDKYNTNNQEAGKILSALRFDRHKSDYNSDSSELGSNLKKKLESVVLQAKSFKNLTGL